MYIFFYTSHTINGDFMNNTKYKKIVEMLIKMCYYIKNKYEEGGLL